MGSAADLRQRLVRHNAGRCPATVHFRLWKVEACFAFARMEMAEAFERYLRSGGAWFYSAAYLMFRGWTVPRMQPKLNEHLLRSALVSR